MKNSYIPKTQKHKLIFALNTVFNWGRGQGQGQGRAAIQKSYL